MSTLLLIIHILVSLFLIFIVLVQGGKGAELGAAFGGGSSQTLFGARGAATMLNKMTTIVAVVFMVTSLILAVYSNRIKSVVPASSGAPASAASPALPGTPAQGLPAQDAPAQIPQQPSE